MSNPYQPPIEPEKEESKSRSPLRFLLWTSAMGFCIPFVGCSLLIFIGVFVMGREYATILQGTYDALQGVVQFLPYTLTYSILISVTITSLVGLLLGIKALMGLGKKK